MAGEKDYYGTKRVTAWPRRRLDDDLPETPQNEPGYAVRYTDGYTSWSPKAVFEAAYRPIDAMGFEGALAAMKEGHKVRRRSWLYAADSSVWIHGNELYRQDAPLPRLHGEDLLADDWMIVDG